MSDLNSPSEGPPFRRPSVPDEEEARLRSLYRYQILETLPEQAYEDLVELASMICEVPIAMVSLIDQKRQWFKARRGIDALELGRDVSFCGHAINQAEPLVVEDAWSDERFVSNPLVIGAPGIRFYAGFQINDEDGHPLGTLCVIDDQPRSLSPQQRRAMMALARKVEDALALRLRRIELEAKNRRLEQARREAEQGRRALRLYAQSLGHELRTPLAALLGYLELISMQPERLKSDPETLEHLAQVRRASEHIRALVDGTLELAQVETGELVPRLEPVQIAALIEDISALVEPQIVRGDNTYQVEVCEGGLAAEAYLLDGLRVRQVLVNVLGNAARHTRGGEVGLRVEERESADGTRWLVFRVWDTGSGMEPGLLEKVFEPFVQGRRPDGLDGEGPGTGLGLSITRELCEKMGGSVEASSEVGRGSEFVIRLPARAAAG